MAAAGGSSGDEASAIFDGVEANVFGDLEATNLFDGLEANVFGDLENVTSATFEGIQSVLSQAFRTIFKCIVLRNCFSLDRF